MIPLFEKGAICRRTTLGRRGLPHAGVFSRAANQITLLKQRNSETESENRRSALPSLCSFAVHSPRRARHAIALSVYAYDAGFTVLFPCRLSRFCLPCRFAVPLHARIMSRCTSFGFCPYLAPCGVSSCGLYIHRTAARCGVRPCLPPPTAFLSCLPVRRTKNAGGAVKAPPAQGRRESLCSG